MVSQLAIAIFGLTAVWLSQSKSPRLQRWACIFGLLGQPFWFYATYIADQSGMFLLCFAYLAAWLRGFYNHWVKGWLA